LKKFFEHFILISLNSIISSYNHGSQKDFFLWEAAVVFSGVAKGFFFFGATVVKSDKFHFTNYKPKEKHFSNEEVQGKNQIYPFPLLPRPFQRT